MKYKPYSIEWSRKRYLSEALQKYFEDGVETSMIIKDIVDTLEEWSSSCKNQSNRIDEVLNKFK